MNKRIQRVGIIAEDDSDVDSIRVLIHRLANNNRIGIKRRVGKGCGRIKRKCHAWAKILKQSGCSLLVLVHDLDENSLEDLKGKISGALNPCPITNHLICIPIKEFEAWLLSDPSAIKNSMHLYKAPKVKGQPESINAPKERLGELIERASKGEKEYLNTRHNSKITEMLSIDLVRSKCPSFLPFYDFIQSNLVN